jgi:CelD/BcsL family acetyltransferase involved in cellulose biosynthesis
VQILQDLSEARQSWMQLQACGLYTHYQRLDWLEAWHVHVGSVAGRQPLVVVTHDAAGPAMLLPLALSKRAGTTVLEWMGWQQGNQNTGLWRPDAYAAADPGKLFDLLRRTARSHGASLIDLRNIPLLWEGRPHPLAAGGAPAKDSVFRGSMEEPAAQLRARLQSADSRKKDTRKQKSLEALPGFAIRTLTSAAEIETGLDCFISHRQERARRTGVPGGLSAPGMRAFLRKLLLAGAGRPTPALQLQVLEAEGEVLATYLTGRSGDTCHAYANSITSGPHTRFSPGIVLLGALISGCCADPKIRTLDLGIGEERYKHPWTQPEPLRDLVIAASLRGWLMKLVLDMRRSVLRQLRQAPALWAGVRAMRRFAAGLRRTSR